MDDNQEGEGNRLPDVVISDIMSRFRAKTIGQLRIESSIIVSLTTSKYFIQKHLQFAKGDINQYGLLVFCEYAYDFGDSIESSSRGSDVSEETANKEIHRFSLNSFLDRDISCFMTEDPFPEEPWVLVGNANGIFCLHCNESHLILWNPTTGGVKRTSSWNDLVGYPFRIYNTSCGFGFGELLNEYFGMVLYNVSDSEYLAFIYKATTNSWRSVASFRGLNGLVEERMIRQNFVIVFVASKFHWTVTTRDTVEMIKNQYIVSFDPQTEMYRRLEIPGEHTKFSCLGSMGTCLSLCCFYEDLGTQEIWMWEDDTWNIAFKLAISNMLGLWSMCRLPDGQLLLGYEWGVVCCNVNDGTYRVVEYPEEITRGVSIQSEFYQETMVSPAELELDDNQEGEGNRLPDLVISDIMSRFRAKTIGQLRIESSIIVSLTTSQYFIQKHLQFAKEDINQYGILVLCEYEYDENDSRGSSYMGSVASDEAANMEIHRFSLNSFLDRDFSCCMIEDPFPEEPWVLVGNANGIFCLHCNDGHLILWNPTTGGVKRTSSWNDLVGLPIRSYKTSCGFGFRELLNEYFGMVLYNVSDSEYLAFFYKATTNSWRSVASFRGLNGLVEERMIPGKFDIIFVASKFHWTVRTEGTVEMVGNQYIVSFDLETEMYRRLENPGEHTKFSCLGSMGTCLSCCCLNEDFGTWEIWMWEDDTWNIAFKLAINVLHLSSMCRLPDGQLLLGCGWGVVCYNVNDDTCTVVEYPEELARCWLLIRSAIYLETMVSPAELELVAGT